MLVFAQSPLNAPAAERLAETTSSHLRAYGVADVRAVRREVAESVSRTRGRQAARLVLRHAKGSKHTVRYATTRDAIARLGAILKA